jgi:hypothetical protein
LLSESESNSEVELKIYKPILFNCDLALRHNFLFFR